MDTAKLLKLAEKYRIITAAHDHYKQIGAIYRAIQNVMGAISRAKASDGTSDPQVQEQASHLNYLIRRLLYNANLYGLSSKTSSHYGNEIKRGIDQLLSYVRGRNPYADINIMVGEAAESAQKAMQGYRPQAIPAQRPRKDVTFEPETITAKPPREKTPEQELAQVERRQRMEQGRIGPGETLYTGKSPETIPAPPGSSYERIPAVEVPPIGVGRPAPPEESIDLTDLPRLSPKSDIKFPRTERYPGPGETLTVKYQNLRLQELKKLSNAG